MFSHLIGYYALIISLKILSDSQYYCSCILVQGQLMYGSEKSVLVEYYVLQGKSLTGISMQVTRQEICTKNTVTPYFVSDYACIFGINGPQQNTKWGFPAEVGWGNKSRLYPCKITSFTSPAVHPAECSIIICTCIKIWTYILYIW